MTTQSDQTHQASGTRSGFMLALGLNFLWINASEIWRYVAVVRPMLQDAFPENSSIVPMTPTIMASWAVWDTILLLAATAFYWLCLSSRGNTKTVALFAATAFTITVFGLIWLGIVNMGLAPVNMISAAMPLAWVEQAVAALIVWWAMHRAQSV